MRFALAIVSLTILLDACARPRPPVQSPGESPDQTVAKPPSFAPAPPCPLTEPVTGTACDTTDLRCIYGEGPSCGRLWACYAGVWHTIARASCRAGDVCPATSSTGMTATDHIPDRAPTCVYPDGVVCAYRPPHAPCSGAYHPYERPFNIPWSCQRPGPVGCLVPHAPGSRCHQEGLTCGGGCCAGFSRCEKGTWVSGFTPCPP
jgi:hypothetical protein